jgi:spore coat polysaccharide biosynthesis protein SpsF
MYTTLGLVEAFPPTGQAFQNTASQHLASRRFGETSLLEWVVRRVTDAQRIDRVVVVCQEGPFRSEIERMVPPDVTVFATKRRDPLGRFAAATRFFSSEAAVRVRVGSPFIDPSLIDRLVISAENNVTADYIGYCSSSGEIVALSQFGLFGEWCRSAAIQQADREATDLLDRRNTTRYLYRRPDIFSLRLIPVPAPLDRDDVRLGINLEEDWEHAQMIYDALGPEALEWQTIAGLLDHHPEIRQRMANLNREEADVY